MNEIKFLTLIQKSVKRTKLILFRPFHIRKWSSLLVIAFLAGALTGGGGGGHSVSKQDQSARQNDQANHQNQPIPVSRVTHDDTKQVETVSPHTTEATPDKALLSTTGLPAEPGASGRLPSQTTLLIAGFLLGIGLLVFFSWMSSRFRFIWIYAIAKNSTAIRVPFKQFFLEANSLFIVTLILLVFSFGLMMIPIGAVLMSVGGVKNFLDQIGHLPFSVWMNRFGSSVLIFMLIISSFSVLHIWIEDFVLPVMMARHSTFLPAWHAVLSLYRENRRVFWFYLFVKIGLNIITGMAIGFIMLAWFIVVLLLSAVVFGLPYYFLAVTLKVNWLFIAYAIAVGIPYFILLMASVLSIHLPFGMFYRCLSLYFMGTIEPQYQLLEIMPEEFYD